MSGTSLDGVDIAHCQFQFQDKRWQYQIVEAETIPYTKPWKDRLYQVENGSALELTRTDIEYGHLLGTLCKQFMDRHRLEPDFIASHGHTIFHQPSEKITLQIGRGSAIAAETGRTVISDFRSLDVALGGQGAPLVPIGDRHLFPEYEFCLNLGGFANISYEQEGQRIAFDICPVNIVLNALAEQTGQPYDADGILSRTGFVHPQLLLQLNNLDYYRKPPPKSLGKEWVQEKILPLLGSSGLTIPDQLSTFTDHVASQIRLATGTDPAKKILVTGGGSLNCFLIERIGQSCKPCIILPELSTIQYKEALIFAYLGVLRWRNEPNCLASVTGASRDHAGGVIC